jgi:hypothetical protein
MEAVVSFELSETLTNGAGAASSGPILFAKGARAPSLNLAFDFPIS